MKISNRSRQVTASKNCCPKEFLPAISEQAGDNEISSVLDARVGKLIKAAGQGLHLSPDSMGPNWELRSEDTRQILEYRGTGERFNAKPSHEDEPGHRTRDCDQFIERDTSDKTVTIYTDVNQRHSWQAKAEGTLLTQTLSWVDGRLVCQSE